MPDKQRLIKVLFLVFVGCCSFTLSPQAASNPPAPVPLLKKGDPVNWWFVFKFNTTTFPTCGGEQRACPFGGTVQNYKSFGQQYVFASSKDENLQQGNHCSGDTTSDPVGATFDEIYNGAYSYVVWNDQFYDDPPIKGCTESCGAPWGHSKGMLAWNAAGAGLVLQVSTPSWPASGSKKFPRKTDGNTLGCIKDDNVKVSQHFFALKLSKADVVNVLKALQNASVVTDTNNPQIVKNGGPADIQTLVKQLGTKSKSTSYLDVKLSGGVELISKPSRLNVPPWQMVSAILHGASLRAATWWATPKIYSTTESTKISCWSDSLGHTGPVGIATSGQWKESKFSLTGGPGNNSNHAKIGVSTSGSVTYTILGDMNQQGALSGQCSSSQNGRGGLFYVVDHRTLHDNIEALLSGDTASVGLPIKNQ
jgi:hypothetical protein